MSSKATPGLDAGRPKLMPETTRIFILLGSIAAIFILQAVFVPGSVTLGQAMNTSRQASALGIVALGQALVILASGIDLSVGAMLTLANVISVNFMRGKDEMFLAALVITIAVCAFVGFINGIFIIKLKIAPFIMTLCTMSVVQGGYLVYTNGAPSGQACQIIRDVSSGYLFDLIPYSTIIWLSVALALSFVLKYTVLGRKIYAVGTNEKASMLCGISAGRTKLFVYIMSGVLTGIAGILMSGYIGTSSLTVGADYVNNSLAAVLIGGNLISGGKGEIWNVVLSSYLIMLLFALLTMLSLGQVGKLIAQGAIIFIVVAIQGRLAIRR